MFRLAEEQIQAYRRVRRAHLARELVATLEGAGFRAELDSSGSVISASDRRGNVTRIEHGDDGLPARIIAPGGAVTRLLHDIEGRLVGVIGADGARVEMPRDGDGRLLALNGAQRGAVFRYDAHGDLVFMRRPDGAVEELVRGDGGVITAAVDGRGAVTRYERRPDGRLMGIVDPLHRRTRLETTEDGALAEIVFADETRMTFIRDAERGVLTLITRGGAQVDFTVDEGERPTGVFWNDGTSTAFAYDKAGRLIRAEDEANEFVAFTHDEAGRVTAEETPGGRVSHEYDADGRLARTITPHGDAISYRYDIDGRVESVVDWEGRVTSFRRTSAGQIAEVRYPGGLVEQREQDACGRPGSARLTAADGSLVSEQRYRYDTTDRLIGFVDGARVLTMDYDIAGRLNGEAESERGVARRYSHDACGNIVVDQGLRRRIGALDELVAVGQTTLDRDEEGNLVRFPVRGGSLDVTFAADGSLVEATLGGRIVSFSYDPLGRRIGLEDGSSGARFGWAGRQLLWEERHTLGSATSVRRDYLYLPGEIVPLAFREHGRTYYLQQDARGAVCRAVDATGAVAWHGRYDGFGVVESEGTVRQPFRLLGQYADDETGLVYNGARYYAPSLRVYVSSDPRWYEPLAQRYAYAANDPYNRADPTGCMWIWIGAGLSLAAQAANIYIRALFDVELGGRRGNHVPLRTALRSTAPTRGALVGFGEAPTSLFEAASFKDPTGVAMDAILARASVGDGVQQACPWKAASAAPVSQAHRALAREPDGATRSADGRISNTRPPHARSRLNRCRCPEPGPIGTLSARYESGRRGSDAIGTDSTGGWSYGKYQIETERGTMRDFLEHTTAKSPSISSALEDAGGYPASRKGNAEFKAAWRAAAKDPSFDGLQHDFIAIKSYEPLRAKIKTDTGLEVDERSHALRDVVWSIAVQHGPGSSVISNALRDKDVSRMTDEEIVEAIYEERASDETTKSGDKVLKYFHKSRKDEQAEVRKRFAQERICAKYMLEAERRAKSEEAARDERGTAPVRAPSSGWSNPGGGNNPPPVQQKGEGRRACEIANCITYQLAEPFLIALAKDPHIVGKVNLTVEDEVGKGEVMIFGQDATHGAGRVAPGNKSVGTTEASLKTQMAGLLSWFAQGTSQGMAKRLFNAFLENHSEIKTFKDQDLDKAVAINPTFIAFADRSLAAPGAQRTNPGKMRIHQALKNAGWDINKVKLIDDLGVLAFNTGMDYWNGLAVMINGVQYVHVHVDAYTYHSCKQQYEIKLRFELYDIFGLDDEDLKKDGSSGGIFSTGAGRGITAWWQLQHQFDHAPLLTKAVVHKTFVVSTAGQ